MNVEYENKYSSTDFLKPAGGIWSKMTHFVFKHKDEINIIDKIYIDFIIEWSNKVQFINDLKYFYPIEARCIGLLIIEILNHNRDNNVHTLNFDNQKELIKTIYKLSGVVVEEFNDLLEWSFKNKETYLGREVISSIKEDQNWVIPCLYTPSSVIDVLRNSWLFIEEEFQKEINNDKYSYRTKSKNNFFGFKQELSILNMGALGTPMFSLLDNHFWHGLRFVIELLNNSMDILSKERECCKELVSITIEVNGELYEQKGSENLWCMYRGGTAECEILSSILMALESVLLNYAKYSEECEWIKPFIDKVFVYILRNCKNIASTSIIVSILTAYPKCWGDKIFSLMKIREIYRWDLHRCSIEISVECYSNNAIIKRERDESNSLPHRKKSLRELMLELSLDDGIRQKCFDIIDNFNKANNNRDEVWTLNLQQMDLRRQQLVEISEDQIMLQTVYVPESAEHLRKFNQKHNEDYLNPITISNWINSVLKGDASVNIDEWSQKLTNVVNYKNNMFVHLELFAAIGIWHLWSKLIDQDKEWCISNMSKFYEDGQINNSDVLSIIPSMLEIVDSKDHIEAIKIIILRIVLFYKPVHMLDMFYSSLKQATSNDSLQFYKSTVWNIVNHYKDRTIDEIGMNNILNNIYELQPKNITKHNISQVVSALKMIPYHLLSVDNEVSTAVAKVNEVIYTDLYNDKYTNDLFDYESKRSFSTIYAHYILNINDAQERKNTFTSFVETINNIVNKDGNKHQPLIDYFDEVMLEMVVAIRTYSHLNDRFWQLWNCLLSFSKDKNTRLFSEALMFKQGNMSDYKISGWSVPIDKRRDIIDCAIFLENPLLTVRMVCKYGMETLLPHILPCIENLLINNTRQLSDCQIYLEQIASKLFCDNKKRIIVKSTKMYSDSFIGILNHLIDDGSAKAFIIRDDFIASIAR